MAATRIGPYGYPGREERGSDDDAKRVAGGRKSKTTKTTGERGPAVQMNNRLPMARQKGSMTLPEAVNSAIILRFYQYKP